MIVKRISVSLDEETWDVLAHVGPNLSGYICTVLQRNGHTWRSARARLMAEGWSGAGLAEACRLLGGVWDLDDSAREVALADAVGQLRAKGLCGDPMDGGDLVTLACEWWAGNQGLRARLTAETKKKKVAK